MGDFVSRGRIKTFVLIIAFSGIMLAGALANDGAAPPAAYDPARVARGKYLVEIGSCNDCHTEGYIQNNGEVPEENWLSGATLGWRGPWGTTYGVNLRLYMSNLSEDQWVQVARKLTSRPPMPWFSLRAMKEEDLRAVYAYIRSLQPVGGPAPEYVPPDRTPAGPYVQFPE